MTATTPVSANAPPVDAQHDWLRLACRHLAHGADLRVGASYGAEESQLRRWEAAGWIARPAEGFAPTLEYAAFALVSAGGKVTPTSEKGRRMIEANHLPNLCAYWWGPGPNAADALASMPAPRGLTVGDRVRYRRTFLRSIGCANDPDMLDWRGVVLSLPHLSRATRLAECEQPPVECHCGLGKPEVDGCAAAEPDCYRCGGSGVARRTRVNVRNLECVK